MIKIRDINKNEKKSIEQTVNIHIQTFTGFFLTFMGKNFLKQMYTSYCEHENSDLLVAQDDNGEIIGFLAYSSNMSGLYKFMIKKHLVAFAWCSLGAFFRKPKVFMRLIRAFLKPGESKRQEKYVELASIGVKPESKSSGIGSQLISELKNRVDFKNFEYISLETDAVNNEAANKFYVKNGFVLARTYKTREGREMNEYRFREEI